MPLARRRAEIEWTGTLEQGRGGFTVGSWMLGEIPVTWASRTGPVENSTSPEELIAAAHASCYAMALTMVLNGKDTPSEGLRVIADCTLDEVDEGFRITTIDLDVQGRVPGLDDGGFQSAAEEAHRICPVSNALKGNVQINVSASLEKS